MRIVAHGGAAWGRNEDARKLAELVREVAGKEQPRVCFVPTAVGDASEAVVRFYETWRDLGQLSHVKFFPWPPPGLRDFALSQNVIVVSGGNTANMLAIWRLHGFDQVLREAWEAGIVLTGGSAGLVCWFEACVTDSFGPKLEAMRDGLGFLPGSACPHYDGEELRRPTYRRLIDEGFPPGIAADEYVALHYEGTELVEVVSPHDGATAYRVDPGSETRLDARRI
jgi:peptidase E